MHLIIPSRSNVSRDNVVENVLVSSGTRVRFALSRVMCPDFDEVCRQTDSNLEVEGRVVFLSDYGKLRKHFAVVQVKGIHVPLIIPVADLKSGDVVRTHDKKVPVKRNRVAG